MNWSMVAVHDGLHVAGFVLGAVVLDHGVGLEHVGADLVAPGDVLLLALDLVAAPCSRSQAVVLVERGS